MALYCSLVDKSIEQNHYTNFGINHNKLKEVLSVKAGTNKLVLACNATVILDGLHDILSRKCDVACLPSFTFPATNQGCRSLKTYGYTVDGGINIGRSVWDISSATHYTNYAVTVNPFGTTNKPCGRPNTNYWVVDNAAGLLTQVQDWFEAGADAVVYSLHATKILSACEGGIVFFNNDKLYEEYNEYINFGFKTLGDGSRVTSPFGSNHKMSELNAAWCLMNLETLDAKLNARSKIADKYKDICENLGIPYIYSLQSFWILGKESASKIQKFSYDFGVDVRPYYQELQIGNRCKTTNLFTSKGVCLPTRSTLSDEDVCQMVFLLGSFRDKNLV